MHAQAVDDARDAVRRRQKPVPDIFAALGQRQANDLAFATFIEQAQFDARRATGADGEVHAIARPGRTEGRRGTGLQASGSEIGG
jgi:hypothetical protein